MTASPAGVWSNDQNFALPEVLALQPAGRTGARHEWQKHCITESLTSPISMLVEFIRLFGGQRRRSAGVLRDSCPETAGKRGEVPAGR